MGGKKSENGEQREGLSRGRKGKELWMQHSRSCQSWINPDVWEIKQMRVSACVRSYPLCFPKGSTHSTVPFSQIRRCQFSTLLYISFTSPVYQRCIYVWLATFNLKFYTTKHTPLFALLFLCIPSLFLYNVIMWREIRGGRAASALMSSCLSLCSSVVRILCLLWFFFFSDNDSQFRPNRKRRGSISFSGAPAARPWASVCVRLCVRWQLRGCLPACRGGRETEMEGREEWRGRVLIMRGERKGGRAVCSEVREREREKKKRRQERETRRTQPLPIDAGGFGSGAPRSADTGRWSQ